jgi:hypothetical protein
MAQALVELKTGTGIAVDSPSQEAVTSPDYSKGRQVLDVSQIQRTDHYHILRMGGLASQVRELEHRRMVTFAVMGTIGGSGMLGFISGFALESYCILNNTTFLNLFGRI